MGDMDNTKRKKSPWTLVPASRNPIKITPNGSRKAKNAIRMRPTLPSTVAQPIRATKRAVAPARIATRMTPKLREMSSNRPIVAKSTPTAPSPTATTQLAAIVSTFQIPLIIDLDPEKFYSILSGLGRPITIEGGRDVCVLLHAFEAGNSKPSESCANRNGQRYTGQALHLSAAHDGYAEVGLILFGRVCGKVL